MSDTNAASPLRLTAEQRLNWTAEQAQKWAKYRESPHLAAPGSSLALDDKIFPLSPPSHLVAFGIAHAVEHLEFFLYPLLNGGAGFPTAPNTLARASVLGSAHALWMLDHPDRKERQRRGLRMAHYEAANERTAVYEVEHIPGANPDPQTRALWQSRVDLCNETMNEAVDAGATIGMTAEDVARRPDDTTIIDHVAKAYIAASPGDSDTLVTAYRLNWRMHSGNAHGLRWPAVWHSEMQGSFARGGAAARVTSGGLEGLSIVASAMALFIKRAVELFDAARQRPS
ncbi:hypothetical protein [Pseudonocardia kongjuensis]